MRDIDEDEGNRLVRIVRRSTGSVVTWRRAQMVLLSAQGLPADKIASVTFTRPDRVRDVIHNFNTDGFEALHPKYKGGRPRTFTLPERREIKKTAKPKPAEHGLPFSTCLCRRRSCRPTAAGCTNGPTGSPPSARDRPARTEGRNQGAPGGCWRPGRTHDITAAPVNASCPTYVSPASAPWPISTSSACTTTRMTKRTGAPAAARAPVEHGFAHLNSPSPAPIPPARPACCAPCSA